MIEVTPLSEVLEKHIDRVGLPQFLETIAIVCEEKADHIRVNWQDKALAVAWDWTAKRLDETAAAAKARGIR